MSSKKRKESGIEIVRGIDGALLDPETRAVARRVAPMSYAGCLCPGFVAARRATVAPCPRQRADARAR